MKDWNKIRKSDDEVIKGIYEKASLLQDQSTDNVSNLLEYKEKKDKKRELGDSKAVSIGVSVAACAFVVLSAARIVPRWRQNNTTTIPKNTMYRSMDEPDIPQYSTDEESSVIESVPMEVLGIVEDVSAGSRGIVLTVNIDKEDDNELENPVRVILSEDIYERINEYLKDQERESVQGLPVLLYIEKYNWLDYFKVINEDGLYLQEQMEDGTVLYQNMDGDVIKN